MIGKLTDEQIEKVLTENILGRIGCKDCTKFYVVPINYI
jgi:nitroimidazol reductase NimA-like FMN-containing flavoprotein (pyridoxamine 5'-phosphate oxidase superfamily)